MGICPPGPAQAVAPEGSHNACAARRRVMSPRSSAPVAQASMAQNSNDAAARSSKPRARSSGVGRRRTTFREDRGHAHDERRAGKNSPVRNGV